MPKLRNLFQKGLIVIIAPLFFQLVFLALLWSTTNQAPGESHQQIQPKLIVAAGGFFILLAISLLFYYYESVVADARRLIANVQLIAEGQKEPLASLETEEYSDVEARLRDLERALQLAVVAAHQGKESRAAELKLRLQEERVRLIFESMPVGLLVLDKHGRIESMNPQAERTFRFEKNKTSDALFHSLFETNSNADETKFIEEVVSQSQTKPRDIMGKRKDGSLFPAELTVQPFEAVEGRRFLALVIDTTEKRELERLKQEFVVMVSHELRTPLTSVGAFLEMFAAGTYDGDPETARARCDIASGNVERLIELINTLLDLEKIEAGRFEIRIKNSPVDKVVQQSCDALHELAEQHGVIIDVTPSGVELPCDPDRITQVIVNLLSNSIKFSNPGDTVSITALDLAELVEISISDNGPGIPDGTEEMIFEKYRQALRPGGNRPKGTGLGLPLCKAIVEQHGGSIGVDTKREKGSRFWFRIPKTAIMPPKPQTLSPVTKQTTPGET